jgi:hypothetical protein
MLHYVDVTRNEDMKVTYDVICCVLSKLVTVCWRNKNILESLLIKRYTVFVLPQLLGERTVLAVSHSRLIFLLWYH